MDLRQTHAPLEPEVGCLPKGKARLRYEFGCKVSIAATLDEDFIVGMPSFPGNPYDSHTVAPALEQAEILTDQRPDLPSSTAAIAATAIAVTARAKPACG